MTQLTKPTTSKHQNLAQIHSSTEKDLLGKKAIHLSNVVFEKFDAIRKEAAVEMEAFRKKIPGEKFGKKVSFEDVAAAVIELSEKSRVLDSIQNRCTRPSDKKYLNYLAYCKANGQITWDDYLVKATESLSLSNRSAN